jgi:hypothetical protein
MPGDKTTETGAATAGASRACRLPALGAFPHEDGTATFRGWAPSAGTVAVRTDAGELVLTPGDVGVFEGRGAAAAGDDHEPFWTAILGRIRARAASPTVWRVALGSSMSRRSARRRLGRRSRCATW